MATDGLHSATLHTLRYDAENDTYTFGCAGDQSAPCHIYPDCDCERWDPATHEHSSVSHEKCWLDAWFAAGQVTYAGSHDDIYCRDHGSCPRSSGEGRIKTSFDDEQVEWEWAS